MSPRFPILLYHRIGGRDGSFMDKYTVTPETFKLQMDWIKQHNWRPIALEDISTEISRKSAGRFLVITFDDGFASNRIHAWPVLDRNGFPSATFIVGGMLGQHNSWDGSGRDCYTLLSSEDLAFSNSRLMAFQSHSATHPKLTALGPNALSEEITKSKRFAQILHPSGSFFAYPFGALNRAVMAEIRGAGFSGGCTCYQGLNSKRTNPFLLRRVEIRENDLGWRLWLKLYTGRDLLSKPSWLSELRVWLHTKLRHRNRCY